MKTLLKTISVLLLLSLVLAGCRFYPPRMDKIQTAESIIATNEQSKTEAALSSGGSETPAETPETPEKADTPATLDQPTNEAEATAKADDLGDGAVMLPSFDKIDYKGPGTLTLVQGDLNAFEIEASQALKDKLYYEVYEGKLKIHLQHLSWDQYLADDIKITISFFSINEIEVEGPVTLKMDGFKADRFELELKGAIEGHLSSLDLAYLDVELKGTGTLTMSGKATEQKVEIQGAAEYNATDLETESTRLDIEGAGAAKVWAKTFLALNLKGGYTVEYWGNPNLQQNVKGLGSIEHKGDK
jgi:hypothetical protein